MHNKAVCTILCPQWCCCSELLIFQDKLRDLHVLPVQIRALSSTDRRRATTCPCKAHTQAQAAVASWHKAHTEAQAALASGRKAYTEAQAARLLGVRLIRRLRQRWLLGTLRVRRCSSIGQRRFDG